MTRIPAHVEQRLDPRRLARLYVDLAEVTARAQQRFGLAQLFGQGAGVGEHRFDLSLVVGRLNNIAAFRHDEGNTGDPSTLAAQVAKLSASGFPAWFWRATGA